MKRQILVALCLLASLPARAEVKGHATQFNTPRGTVEQCVALDRFPDGVYKKKDDETEAGFCKIDVNDGKTAMCPKTWSTSPGTILVSTEKSALSVAAYESQRCGSKSGHDKLAKFKNTMNANGTSGTFSTASLLYYHFARYFDTDLIVPPAVYRTFDKDAHFERVSAHAKGTGMNAAGWSVQRAAEKNPASYKPTDELFTPDRHQIYGVLLDESGTRYGPEVNGTRASGWGKGQNNDFQKTPGFMALRSAQPLKQAIQEGLSQSRQDPKIKATLGPSPVPDLQMVYWMKEITEITVLDYIFQQQDRIGNIDYIWTWVYVADGEVHDQKVKDAGLKGLPRAKMGAIKPPAEIAGDNPTLLQRTSIGDNDAGGRAYANFTKTTQMLEKIHHYNDGTYYRLMRLAADFQHQGPLYHYVQSTFGLTSAQLSQAVNNTIAAAKILHDTCAAKALRFDLYPEDFLRGNVQEHQVSCDAP
jgi:hypothetical protein